MTENWTRNPVRCFQHLLRETDAIGLDPARLIAEAREAGANVYIAMGGGFSAWYPTRLASQTRNPHMEGDVLGGLVAAGQAAGMRVLIRMDISKGRQGTEHAHPDWFVRRPDGTIGKVWQMPQLCATGSFWERENFAILAELLDAYPADGFFYNYFYVPRCYCARCQAIVTEATGAPVPLPGTRTPAYEQWRQQHLAAYTARMRDFIRARRPQAVLVPYHHVRDGWDVRAMAAASDIVGTQASNPLVPNPVDPQPMWNHWAAEEVLKGRAVKPAAAPLLIQSASEFFASRQTSLPSGRLVRNLALVAAHGGTTAPSINGTLEPDDPRFVPALKAFGAYQERNADWYRGLRSTARIAIVRSEPSLYWGSDQGRLAGSPDRPGHVAEFRGIYEALAAVRYPTDIVVAGGLEPAGLAGYGMLVVPDVSCLSAADAAVLDAYVQAGGQLLVTGEFAARNETGEARRQPVSAALPALPGPATAVPGAYFELVAAELRRAVGGIPHIAAAGEFWSPPAASSASRQDLRLIGPFENNAPEFTVVEGPGAAPGLIGWTYGKGRAQWLPWRPGALYHRYGIPEYAAVIGRLASEAVGPAPVSTSAGPEVDFTLYAHPRGMVLHVLNGASVQGRPLTDPPPLAGFEVSVATRATEALSLTSWRTLATSRQGEYLRFALDRLEVFEAIALIDASPAAA